MATATLLHVTNGGSVAGTLRETSLGGATLPWQDALHAGPVPDVARPEFLRVRATYLSDCGWGSRRALFAALERRDRQFLDALARSAEVVLWFEHDLYDQLQLLDVLTLLGEQDARPEAIVVGSFPGRPDFVGLGELDPDELEMLWPDRQRVTPEAIEAAAEAWAAVRAPDPTRLAELVRRPVAELPFASSALRRLLEELPAPRTGLSTTERLALEAVRAGAATPHAAFVAAQQHEAAPFLGDTWFHRTLAVLGHGAARLLETQDGDRLPALPPPTDSSFARLPLRITELGERVLAGEADRVELLGIGRWVGGTCISTHETWRWHPATETLEP